jgi:hypothetical protein
MQVKSKSITRLNPVGTHGLMYVDFLVNGLAYQAQMRGEEIVALWREFGGSPSRSMSISLTERGLKRPITIALIATLRDLLAVQDDFRLDNHGSVSLLFPLTVAAKAWVRDHLPADVMTHGGGVAIEHRYVGSVCQGIQTDGLSLEEGV